MCITRSFTFVSDPDQHVCEVQLVHEGMLTARKHCNAHAAYAKFRSALELLETFGLMTLPPLTDEAKMDVSTEAKVASEELTQHHKFVQELECEYITFVKGYQQKLGILPLVDTDGHTEKSVDVMTLEDDDSASHATTTASTTELKVVEMQQEITSLHQQNTSQQREITSQQREITSLHQQHTSQQREITSLHHEIEQIRLQLEQFMKTSQDSN